MLGEMGAYIIDADQIARSLVEPEKPAWKEIIDLLGPGILNEDGTLDRSKIADIVFQDVSKKEKLEAVLHPLIIAEEERRYQEIAGKNPQALVVVEAALLIESGNYRRVQKVIVVACDEKTQLERIAAQKEFAPEDVKRRISQQMPLSEKMKFADYIIHNDSGLSELRQKVENLFKQLNSLVS